VADQLHSDCRGNYIACLTIFVTPFWRLRAYLTRSWAASSALYVSGLHFSISAAIGFVSLFGVSVMDGILMITFYNQELTHGFAPVDAMYRAASTRMRPLLMTALSACIGLLPAAIFNGYRQPGAAPARNRDRGVEC